MKLIEIGEIARLRRLVVNHRELSRAKHAVGEVEVRFRDGRRFLLRGGPSDVHAFRRVFLRDEYRLRGGGPWPTVLDLGGNIGCFAFRVASQAGRVIVYEPDPANLALLERSVACLTEVSVVPQAVAGAPGVLELHTASSGRVGGRSSLFADQWTQQDTVVEVKATTLDAVFEEHAIERCELMKIDVEGAEYEILHAAGRETLERIDRIVGEYHDVRPEDPRTRIDAFRRFLEGAGYEVEVAPSKRHPNSGLFFAQRL